MPTNQNPSDPIFENPLDEELVDGWGVGGWDDDELEFLEDELAEDVNFIEDNMALEAHENFFQEDEITDKPSKEGMELDASEVSGSAQIQGTQASNLPVLDPIVTTVRRSNKIKKPLTRWNEEAGFLPHPPKPAKKKNPRRPDRMYAFFKLFRFQFLVQCSDS